MAKKTLQLEVVDQEPKQTGSKSFDPDDIIEELENLRDKGAEIYGRVYRIENPQDPPTTQKRTFLYELDVPVYENYILQRSGPGVYKLRYKARTQDGSTIKKDVTFRIQGETSEKSPVREILGIQEERQTQAAPQIPQAAPARSFLDILLNGLTADKITAFGISLKALKDLFSPPPPPTPDYMRLIEILAGNQQKQSVSDAILIKCMDSMEKQHQPPTILQQIKELQAVKEAVKDETENQEQGGENMNMMIKMALEYLPLLLKKNNNDFKAVGQQAAQNPMIQDLIKKDGNLAQQFINAALKQYGPQAAQQLAAGFGYTSQYIPPQAAPVSPQAAPDDCETEENEPEENQGE